MGRGSLCTGWVLETTPGGRVAPAIYDFNVITLAALVQLYGQYVEMKSTLIEVDNDTNVKPPRGGVGNVKHKLNG